MDTVAGGESTSAGPEEQNPQLSSSTTDCCTPQKLPTDPFSSASPLQVLGATGTGPISQGATQTTGQECWFGHPHGVPTDGGGTGVPCHWPPSTFPWPGSDIQHSSKVPKGYTPGYGGVRLHARPWSTKLWFDSGRFWRQSGFRSCVCMGIISHSAR